MLLSRKHAIVTKFRCPVAAIGLVLRRPESGEISVAGDVDPGKKVWWAKVRLKPGRTGWVDMDHAKFDNVDRFR
jgi:hypothetical protein